MPVSTLEWKNNGLKIIDQALLPVKYRFINCHNEKDVFKVIRALNVRGAPAIGIAGAFGMYLGLRHSKAKTFSQFYEETEKVEKYLASSRPTARNLFWALERMKDVVFVNKVLSVEKIKARLLYEAKLILDDDKKICRAIGRYGSKLIKSGDVVLTHCNAGALATADFGTALAVIYQAHTEKKKIKVFADETRPVLQGARLTAWELRKEKIDVTLICDNMAASLMAKGKIDKVIVGADRIASNGDVANKIGTYNVACLCKMHNVPFYVAAPLSTFDFNIGSGDEIIIEERDPDEVRKVFGLQVAPKNVKVYNPSFDVTPNRFVTGIITEKGIVKKPYVQSIKKLKNSTRSPLFNKERGGL